MSVSLQSRGTQFQGIQDCTCECPRSQAGTTTATQRRKCFSGGAIRDIGGGSCFVQQGGAMHDRSRWSCVARTYGQGCVCQRSVFVLSALYHQTVPGRISGVSSRGGSTPSPLIPLLQTSHQTRPTLLTPLLPPETLSLSIFPFHPPIPFGLRGVSGVTLVSGGSPEERFAEQKEKRKKK